MDRVIQFFAYYSTSIPRTAIKAYRRQWDPQTSSGRALSVENNIESPWWGPPRFLGYGSDGHSNYSCHFLDFRGITNTSVAGSEFCRRNRAMPPGSSELNVPTYSASPDERVALEALAMMAEVWVVLLFSALDEAKLKSPLHLQASHKHLAPASGPVCE
jgi:hypothetical protein